MESNRPDLSWLDKVADLGEQQIKEAKEIAQKEIDTSKLMKVQFQEEDKFKIAADIKGNFQGNEIATYEYSDQGGLVSVLRQDENGDKTDVSSEFEIEWDWKIE